LDRRHSTNQVLSDVPDQNLSQQLQDFLTHQINSVVQVEVLLLLFASTPRWWTASQIAGELRIDEMGAAAQAEDLYRRGLLQCRQERAIEYSYQAADTSLNDTVRQLAVAYADRRVTIISIIYSKPIDPIKSFADAFRLRKDKPNG
jgi:hypothetical protein